MELGSSGYGGGVLGDDTWAACVPRGGGVKKVGKKQEDFLVTWMECMEVG